MARPQALPGPSIEALKSRPILFGIRSRIPPTSISNPVSNRAQSLSVLPIRRLYSSSSVAATNHPPADSSKAVLAGVPEKPLHLDDAESTIWDRLVAAFAPTELAVHDVSGGCGSMYSIDITSAKFRGVNMLKQQRMVNAELADLMEGWHGVQLRTKAAQSQ